MEVKEPNILVNNDYQYKELSSFFYFSGSSFASTDQQFHNNNNIDLSILQYFTNTNNDYKTLNKYPQIRKVFLEYNTPLPSSAPVERLFSFATITNLPKVNRLTDKMFEQKVILKANLLNKRKQ